MSRTPKITPQIATVLAVCLFFGLAGPVWGQSSASCDVLTDEVYRLFQEGDHGDTETLRRLTVTSGQAERCYGQERILRRIWLREMRIWASDQLGRRTRFVENYWLASRLAESFWDEFGQAATPLSKANVARHLIRFRSFQGDFEGASMALDTAKQYIDVLAFDRQLQVHLTEASLFYDDGQHRRAVATARKVLGQVAHADGIASGEDLTFVRARARHLRAVAQMKLEESRGPAEANAWDKVIDDLIAAVGAFDRLGMQDRQIVALAGLAEAYGRTGRADIAEEHLRRAFTLARRDANPEPKIVALLRRGRIRVYQGRLDEAEGDFDRGLALGDSARIGKHTYDLMFERARLDEARRALVSARDRYARLARLDVSFADGAVRAASLRREAAHRAADIERVLLRRERWLLRLALFALVLLTLVALVVAVESRKRLAQEAWRRELEAKLSGGAMLRYVYEAIHCPRRVAAQIRRLDSGLARRLDRNRLRGRTELYQCLALLVLAIEGREITHDGVRINLQRLFKRNAWDWPTSTETWKAHFREHPIE